MDEPMGHPALYQFIEQAAVLAMAGEFEDVEADDQGVWFTFPGGRRVQLAVMADEPGEATAAPAQPRKWRPAWSDLDPGQQMQHLRHDHGRPAPAAQWPGDPAATIARTTQHVEGHAHDAGHDHDGAVG